MADSKDEKKVVPVAEGVKYGYIGQVQDSTPNENYTIAGVVDGTAKASDTPKATKPSTSKSS